MPKILIVDDNQQITTILSDYAISQGFTPVIARDGNEAIRTFHQEDPDIILLDVMMPGKDGFSVCREIRQSSTVPIIMVTARGEDFEKIMGLEIGADDYILKPFSLGEVMARIKAILRRITPLEETSAKRLVYDNLVIDMDDYLVELSGNIIPLTKKEIELLFTLASGKNKVYTRDQLLSLLWGYDYFGDNRTVDSHIKRLRSKLYTYEHPNWEIQTIWGVGYKFMTHPTHEKE